MQAHIDHTREHQEYRFVYPVLSRRSKGISLGVNLSPHRRCNFDCLYCEVDRSPDARDLPKYDNAIMKSELEHLIQSVMNGQLFKHGMFAEIPPELRRLNDIAFSGDGEPTSESCFLEACHTVSQIKKDHGLNEVKIVLISNSTMFHKTNVQQGLNILMQNQGEVWAKLDAGTEAYYREIDKTSISFQRVLDNILLVARQHPIIIQTLFTIMDNKEIPPDEIEAYAKRLKFILEQGGRITEVHLHTLARPPAYPRVESLSKTKLDNIARSIQAIVDLPITTFAGRAG